MTKSARARAAAQPKKAQKAKKKSKKSNNTTAITNSLLNKAMSAGMAKAGMLATKAISRIVGVGDYTVKSNSIETNGGVLGGEVPHFGKENNSTRIRHREFITDVVVPANPSNFSNTSYVINPSNKTLFPWLASLAENWQQYRVHGMVFYYKTTTSDYAANGALGKIAMATNYNVRDSAYANMIELENAEFSVSGKPSMSRIHPIECASNNGLPLVRYVRVSQYDASGGDDRLYDVGKFQFATQGLPGSAGNVLGELWCSYDIEFYKPIVGRDPTQVQYEPVVVPQFNNLAGNNTRSLYMVEKTKANLTGVTTRAQFWELMHRPDKFVRIAPLQIDSALITRSINRPTPDPNPANYTYPAYWTNPVNVTDKRELRITRPGIWYMHMRVDVARRPSEVTNIGDITNFGLVSQTPNSLTTFNLPAIQIECRNIDNTLNTDGGIQVLSSNNNHMCTPNTKENIYAANPLTGDRYGAYLFRSGADWTLMMWVPESLVSEGKYVAVRFQSWAETADTIGTDYFEWINSEIFNPNNITNMEFEVGVVSVSEQTYYRPIQQGLTQDDTTKLETSVSQILALVPKLKDLGLLN